MPFIRLQINTGLRRVFAVGNGVPGGNIVIDSHENVEWRNGQPPNEQRVFLVRFFNWSLASRTPIWPFADGAVGQNQQCVDADGVRWLRVAETTLAPAFDPNLNLAYVEYKVYVEAAPGAITCIRDGSIEPLDPMIIVRPPKAASAPDSVLLGATSAVLGAAVGALVTWALS